MPQRPLSLEPLSVLNVCSAELVSVAADSGFEWFSMFGHAPTPDMPVDPAVDDSDIRFRMRAEMDKRHLKLLNIECFNLTPQIDPREFAPGLECGAFLGARTATAIVWDNPDRADAIAKFRRLCAMAAEHDIVVNLEFFIGCDAIGTIDEAVTFVEEANCSNGRIVVDFLHLMRTSGGLKGLDRISPELIGGVQINDGPAAPPSENPLGEALERGIPGTGVFPIAALVQRLPDHLVLGVEVPIVSQMSTVSALEHARRIHDATRTVLAELQR